MPPRRPPSGPLLALALLAASGAGAETPLTGPPLPELLYVSEGNRLHRFDVDTIARGPLLGDIVFENASADPERGRDINGMVCGLPDGSGLLLAGEDTGQPHPPAGWGVLTGYGVQVGKLATTALTETAEPYGCAVDAAGRLFTTEVGAQFFGAGSGQLILWFPPYRGFPGRPDAYPDTDALSPRACKLATDIGTALGVAVDDAGRVYVAAASGREVLRFSPPFPTGPGPEGGCGATDPTGAPLAEPVQRERFIDAHWSRGLVTYSGLAIAPNGNLYVASVATGRIAEFDLEGNFVRAILEPRAWLPPYATGYPMGLAVDRGGSLYYADIDLRREGLSVGPGPDGRVWRIGFDADDRPLPPQPVVRGLAFPDGLGILPGDLEILARSGELAPLHVQTGAVPRPAADEWGAAAILFGVVALITVGAVFYARRGARPPIG